MARASPRCRASVTASSSNARAILRLLEIEHADQSDLAQTRVGKGADSPDGVFQPV